MHCAALLFADSNRHMTEFRYRRTWSKGRLPGTRKQEWSHKTADQSGAGTTQIPTFGDPETGTACGDLNLTRLVRPVACGDLVEARA
ncbi:hypothetical protein NDU88_002471 [Pleurodeles waltl]|uniref:Uncharacterized protein n=1 Tax=Pleurodeles waltl TaxID=8319 RepID=A0AAV7VZF5_PLEWA|nr:hypothetical protein NDU88_002471 [Pleurodeles waltl]